MSIVDTIYSYLPSNKTITASGWTKFNAVCCHHNGTTSDTRARGGVIKHDDGISYHCFNCGFKASYMPGWLFSQRLRMLLEWLGMSSSEVSKLSFDAMRLHTDTEATSTVMLPTFEEKELPAGSIPLVDALTQFPEKSVAVAEYALSRHLDIVDGYDFKWSPSMPDRLIMPCYYNRKIVGWTARRITDGNLKYFDDKQQGYVFNVDAQPWSRKFVIAVEGPIDAISIEGIAVLGAEISDKQALIINRLNRPVIYLPDRDQDGLRTIPRAIELGWAVSMPDWGPGIKDANKATVEYGKLWTLHSIITAAERYDLKIKLRANSWFKQ